MGSCVGCMKDSAELEISWYRAGSPESLGWIRKETGFGYKCNKSYRDAVQKEAEANRNGNRNSELSGRIVFYTRASKKMNYAKLPRCPTITVDHGMTLFAKAFLPVPLSRFPIGQNNIVPGPDLRGNGGIILTSKPRVIAIYLDIDGVPQPKEHFCEMSNTDTGLEQKVEEIKEKELLETYQSEIVEKNQNSSSSAKSKSKSDRPEPVLELTENPSPFTKAVQGSFLTYKVSSRQDPYFFIHLPLIASLNDTNIVTGPYGETLVQCFTELVEGLPPGQHSVHMRIFYFYDHRSFSGYVLDRGYNAQGIWYKTINNFRIRNPHPHPTVLTSSDGPVASGGFVLNIPSQIKLEVLLERTPPPEVYSGMDLEDLRRTARVLAAGQFCEPLGLIGLPDWVVLSSPIVTLYQGGSNHDVITFAALWLNPSNPLSPQAIGTMIKGSMSKKLDESNKWLYVAETENGKVQPPRRLPIKNKFINTCMKGRRFSLRPTQGLPFIKLLQKKMPTK